MDTAPVKAMALPAVYRANHRTCLSSIRARVQGFAHARTPMVLHFSAFISFVTVTSASRSATTLSRMICFALYKGAFHDALALRYNWQPLHALSTCGCGVKFSVENALSCLKGGFPSIRHNEIRDLIAY